MDKVKRCSACGEIKALVDFHRSERCHDGRDRYCAACRRQRQRYYRRPTGGFWTAGEAPAVAADREALARQRKEDERRDQEIAALLRSQREEIAGR
jgi:hypothetical protein